jgi:hypothetical protein
LAAYNTPTITTSRYGKFNTLTLNKILCGLIITAIKSLPNSTFNRYSQFL